MPSPNGVVLDVGRGWPQIFRKDPDKERLIRKALKYSLMMMFSDQSVNFLLVLDNTDPARHMSTAWTEPNVVSSREPDLKGKVRS